MRRPSYRQYHALRPRVLPMSDSDRLINDELRSRARDMRDWRDIRHEMEEMRRQRQQQIQRFTIGLGTLTLLAIGLLAGMAAL